MAGFKAATTAFFDDSVRNVAAAKQAGIFSVLVGDTADSLLLRPATDLAPFVNSLTMVISVEISLGFWYDCWRRFSACALAQAVSQKEAILHCGHSRTGKNLAIGYQLGLCLLPILCPPSYMLRTVAHLADSSQCPT